MRHVRVALVAAVPVVALAVVVVARPAGAQDAPLRPGGSYHALSPVRILDTRTGLGGAKGPTRSVTVRTAGVARIPASGVSALAINITVSAPTGNGSAVAYPAGTSRPAVANANYVKGQTVAAMTIVSVNTAGEFTIYSLAPAQLSVDVAGYFTTPQAATTGGLYNNLTPARIVDTRTRLGGTAPGPKRITTVQVTGVGGVPASGVAAVVVNTAVLAPTADGYVSAYPAGNALPTASTINFARGVTRSNRAIVPVGTRGKVSFYNSAGTSQLLIDVTGYFTSPTSSAGGSYYVPSPAERLIDTRNSSAPTWSTVGTTNSIPLTVDGSANNAAPSMKSVTPTTAVLLNLTTVAPPASGFLSLYPAGTPRPRTSDLNSKVGTVVSNAAIAAVGANGAANLYSSSAGNILVDASGYFVRAPATPTPAGMWNIWDQSTYPATQPMLPAVRTNSIHGVDSIIEFRSGESFALRPDGTVVGWTAPEANQPNPAHPFDSSASVHTVAGLTGVTGLAASGMLSGTGLPCAATARCCRGETTPTASSAGPAGAAT